MSTRHAPAPNDLRAFWMPFTSNRQFKQAPRMFVAADGMHYTTSDGRRILDGTAGLWCCNAGHGRPRISEAIADAGEGARLCAGLPDGPSQGLRARQPPGRHGARGDGACLLHQLRVARAVETALKIAIAYQRAIGQGTRTRLIGRERGYHGVNFGGISVGGIVNNRKFFGTMLTGVDHMPHTHLPAKNRLVEGPARARRRARRRARAHRDAARSPRRSRR